MDGILGAPSVLNPWTSVGTLGRSSSPLGGGFDGYGNGNITSYGSGTSSPTGHFDPFGGSNSANPYGVTTWGSGFSSFGGGYDPYSVTPWSSSLSSFGGGSYGSYGVTPWDSGLSSFGGGSYGSYGVTPWDSGLSSFGGGSYGSYGVTSWGGGLSSFGGGGGYGSYSVTPWGGSTNGGINTFEPWQQRPQVKTNPGVFTPNNPIPNSPRTGTAAGETGNTDVLNQFLAGKGLSPSAYSTYQDKMAKASALGYTGEDAIVPAPAPAPLPIEPAPAINTPSPGGTDNTDVLNQFLASQGLSPSAYSTYQDKLAKATALGYTG